MAKERQQHLERSPLTLTDQHGRTWHATSEQVRTRSGHKMQYPVGQIIPAFTPPHGFVPPQHYLKPRDRQPGLLDIDYDRWIRDLQEAHAQYQTTVLQYATQIHGAERAVEVSRQPTRELMMLCGEPPLPLEPVYAAKQGNRYALGLTDRVDERVEPFLVEWGRRVGGSRSLDLAVPDFSEPDFSDEPETAKGRKRQPAEV